MTEIQIIQLAFIPILFLQALYNHYCILDIGSIKHTNHWHNAQAAFYTAIVLLFAFYHGWLLFPLLLVQRLIVFQNSLNILRGRSFFYMSATGMDGALSRILGRHAGIIVFIGCLLAIAALNILAD